MSYTIIYSDERTPPEIRQHYLYANANGWVSQITEGGTQTTYGAFTAMGFPTNIFIVIHGSDFDQGRIVPYTIQENLNQSLVYFDEAMESD